MNRTRRFAVSVVLSIVILSPSAAERSASAGEGPKVTLNERDFRDRVYACWLGKNIGGTLGMPVEGRPGPHQLTFYTNVGGGEPAANDDLDLQLLWLKALEENNGRVDARILGQYWLKYVPVDWNEYGVGKRNMRLGLLPPVSGQFNNSQWKHSNGAWCRTDDSAEWKEVFCCSDNQDIRVFRTQIAPVLADTFRLVISRSVNPVTLNAAQISEIELYPAQQAEEATRD